MLREKAESKVEQQLQRKDEELGEIRDKLQLVSEHVLAVLPHTPYNALLLLSVAYGN